MLDIKTSFYPNQFNECSHKGNPPIYSVRLGFSCLYVHYYLLAFAGELLGWIKHNSKHDQQTSIMQTIHHPLHRMMALIRIQCFF